MDKCCRFSAGIMISGFVIVQYVLLIFIGQRRIEQINGIHLTVDRYRDHSLQIIQNEQCKLISLLVTLSVTLLKRISDIHFIIMRLHSVALYRTVRDFGTLDLARTRTWTWTFLQDIVSCRTRNHEYHFRSQSPCQLECQLLFTIANKKYSSCQLLNLINHRVRFYRGRHNYQYQYLQPVYFFQFRQFFSNSATTAGSGLTISGRMA